MAAVLKKRFLILTFFGRPVEILKIFKIQVKKLSQNIGTKMTFVDVTSTGFEMTKTSQLWRALLVLKFSSYDVMVRNSIKMFNLGNKILGRRVFGSIMRRTFYGQFCLGNTAEEIIKTAASLEKTNIKPMLMVPMEEEAKSNNCTTSEEEAWLDRNKEIMINCININNEIGNKDSIKFTQIKLTAIISTDLLNKMTKMLNKIRGEYEDKLEERDNIGIILWENFSNQTKGINADHRIFDESESERWRDGIARVYDVCKRAYDVNVHLLIDAEYTNINPAIRIITYEMMRQFNKESAIVRHTYQAYLKKTPLEVEEGLTFCRHNDACFGAKIVRGAYMVAERHQAAIEGRDDPVCGDWSATNRNYNKIITDVIERIASQRDGKINVTVATHNEESVNVAMEMLRHHNVDRGSGLVTFAQTYGLSDHISNWLGKNGYSIYKSTPIGPIEDTLPYLSRRAQENNSVMESRKDRMLIKRELRKRSWFKDH